MVKFIATDLDGTLLDGERKLPAGMFDLIGKLNGKGVLFAPASGRQYANLARFFSPVKESVLFVCENGALVKFRGQTLYLDPVPVPLAQKALREIRLLPGLYPVLCGEERAYIEDEVSPFAEESRGAYDLCEKVDSLDDVVGREAVCKIAVYDAFGSAAHCIRLLPPRLPELRTVLSGAHWCDVSAPTACKGEAIRFVREKFGFRREECVAFGDHMNDYEMLLECGRAYVPENAYPPLKELVGQTIPSNLEGGVFKKLEEIYMEVSL